jgi:polysaccharide pyruvyl transferase WcaK-like protein
MSSSRSSSAFARSRRELLTGTDANRAIKILVEPSAHHLLNMGDVAMLTVTVRRLRRLWPDASIGVIADEQARLARHCPGVEHVPAAGRRLWFDEPYLGVRTHEALPGSLARRLRDAERLIRRRRPELAAAIVRARRRLKREDRAEFERFLEWVSSADVAVVVGAGLLTDAFASAALTVLELLEAVGRRGAATAMMGQGIGPLTDPALLSAGRRVLPSLGLICLREERAGRPILRSLGVPEERVFTTGDDAIELALESRRDDGNRSGLGLSLRVARYSEVDEQQLATVGVVLRHVCESLGAEPVSVPISSYWNEGDAEVIARALPGTGSTSDPPDTPLAVIARIQQCRVVVTGSYHAGVFALAQGIPVVGLAATAYYVDKFMGLADQFDGHCSIVMLDDDRLGERLEEAVRGAWASAAELAPKLIAAAHRQHQSAETAMERLRDLGNRSFTERKAIR